jgi:dihydropteroate synthase
MQVPSAIYESFRTYGGKVALQPEHQKRWERSLRKIGFEGEIPDVVALGLNALPESEQDFKIWITINLDGETEINFAELPRYSGSFLWEKWKVKRVEGARENPELKSTSTEFQKAERKKAASEGFDEILMIEADGQVREGGISNVFFEKDGVLITPDEGMLPGICRQLILTAAEQLEIPVELRAVSADELDDMDTMFMTNSVRGIIPTATVTHMMQRLAGWCASLIYQRTHDDRETKFMGVVNTTPDSFSDGGRFDEGGDSVLDVVSQMILDGASIIDVGGESTGPGSKDVSLDEELGRVVPVIAAIRSAHPEVLISVDTWKSEVADAAVKAGANMINDVTGGRGDQGIAKVAAAHNVPLVLMYSKDAGPRTSSEAVEYEDVMATIKSFLKERVDWARTQGVDEIIIDPGMGAFLSTNPKYSWEVIDRIEELRELGCQILVGTSRKSFLGEDRFGGTLLTTQMLRGRVDYLRVHDVYENATVCS